MYPRGTSAYCRRYMQSKARQLHVHHTFLRECNNSFELGKYQNICIGFIFVELDSAHMSL